MGRLLQNERPQPGHSSRLHASALTVPVDFALLQKAVRMMLQQVLLGERCGKHNPALPGTVIHAGCHDVGRARQRLPLAHGRPRPPDSRNTPLPRPCPIRSG